MPASTEEVAGSVPPPWAHGLRGGRAWRRRFHSDPLAGTSLALLVNTAGTGVLGFLYWIVAARLFPAPAVGLAGAIVAACTLLSGVGQLNLSGMLMRFLPVAGPHSRRLVRLTYLTAAGATGLVAVALSTVLSVAGLIPPAIALVPGEVTLILAMSILTALFTLEDCVLLALRRAALIPLVNIAFGVAKLLLLPVFAGASTAGSLLLSWAVPLVVTVPLVTALLYGRVLPARPGTPRPVPAPVRAMLVRFVLGDAGAGLFTQTWTYSLPILVAASLGAAANASFYTAFLIATTVDLAAANLASAMTVKAALHPHQVRRLTGLTMSRALLLTGTAVTIGVAAAPYVLQAFGTAYAADPDCLRLLLLACLPRAVLAVYYAVCRTQRRTHRSAAMQASVCVSILITVAPAADRWGLAGVAGVVLVCQLAACAAAVPALSRMTAGRHRTPRPTIDALGEQCESST